MFYLIPVGHLTQAVTYGSSVVATVWLRDSMLCTYTHTIASVQPPAFINYAGVIDAMSLHIHSAHDHLIIIVQLVINKRSLYACKYSAIYVFLNM